ncbi:hypothetical protein A6A04_09140 [Paramagnetospirillum marisnigri]|uniref:Molybdopterin-guanine dinucleotide biosynthesis protein MobB n=1 Tax=Paramagnetospirillum marisnigri TaxID=1285242 RepID=A0A178M5K8_9PROT|nr:DUF2889 domain-containing protein [Paramagnetospirillum marisnigri]OAN44032.1 hypothetical protein A6A04_09140 [Paramagnetospirillum marisnigri]
MTGMSDETRQLVHTRSITVRGYRLGNGNWEIESRLTDIKAEDIQGLYRLHIPAGEPIHDMLASVVVSDDMTVLSARASIDGAPFPMCADIAPAFAALAGLHLGTGFMREVRARFGGRKGCTHLAELMGVIAATAFQTIYPALRAERGEPPGRPALIDTCHAFAAEGEVVARQWPQWSSRDQGSST